MKWINRSQIAVVSVAVMTVSLMLPSAQAGGGAVIPNWHPDQDRSDNNCCTNPVVVASSTNTPVIVRDVDNAQQPYQEHSGNLGSSGGSLGADFAVVPAGKRLVIEFVSVSATVPTGQKVISALIEERPKDLPHYLTLTPQGTIPSHAPLFLPAVDLFVASQPMRMYVEAGQHTSVFIDRDDTTGDFLFGATITGYYINVP